MIKRKTYNEDQYKQAIDIAFKAFHGQLCKSNKPAVLHSMNVSASKLLETWEERIVAALHDVLEDCEERYYSYYKMVIKTIFDENILQLVLNMTHQKGEPWEDYLDRVKSAKVSHIVRRVPVRTDFLLVHLWTCLLYISFLED